MKHLLPSVYMPVILSNGALHLSNLGRKRKGRERQQTNNIEQYSNQHEPTKELTNAQCQIKPSQHPPIHSLRSDLASSFDRTPKIIEVGHERVAPTRR